MAINNIFICLLCRILSCIQAGAGCIWSYWPTHGPSIRGLVWMRGTNPRKVVTQEEWATLLPRASLLHPAAGFYCHRSCPYKQTLACFNEKTPLQIYYSFPEREYNTFKQPIVYHYHALFYIKQSVYEEKKEACVLWLSLTFVFKCPFAINSYPKDKSSPSVIYLIQSAKIHPQTQTHTHTQWWTKAQVTKQTKRMGTQDVYRSVHF